MKSKLLFAILVLACAGISAFAQTDAGSIRVLVEDDSGAVIPDAIVTLSNVSTGIAARRDTSSDGYATFSPMTRGQYVGEITKEGFQTTRVTDVKLEVDERKLIRV